jgi:phage FluMu protein Com
MTPEGLRPIRCASCGKLICEADGTVVFRCPRCKQLNATGVRSRLALLRAPESS